jgi:hypothetical protein
MNSTLAVKNPSEMPWTESPTAAGCFSKKLFTCGAANLGLDGSAGPYTTFYRLAAGASYPAWRLVNGSLEVQGLVGTLLINGGPLEAGEWVQLLAGDEAVSLSSQTGCEFLAILRGDLELVKR